MGIIWPPDTYASSNCPQARTRESCVSSVSNDRPGFEQDRWRRADSCDNAGGAGPQPPGHSLSWENKFQKKKWWFFFGLGFRAKYLNGHFLPFFPVFGLFLATKTFSILAGLTIFFVTTIPNSGASEYPEESFLDAKNPKKKVEWSVA